MYKIGYDFIQTKQNMGRSNSANDCGSVMIW